MNNTNSSDVSWRPIADVEIARTRARMLSQARQYFEEQQVLEVETSMLSKYAITDPNIESVRTSTSHFTELFLHTSPEFKMKRLLAAGFSDIYQICKVFRDGEIGQNHLPEFTLVEWYRNRFNLREIMQDTVSFVSCLLELKSLRSATEYVSYRESFQQTLGIDPVNTDSSALADLLNADEQLRKSIGNDLNTWLDLALTDRVVSEFAGDRLTVLFHYPICQAALARQCPDDTGVADRFEVFHGNLELANGFVELTDANEQSARFKRERNVRTSLGLPAHEIDQQFISALDQGLPQCAGVAVGFDRLLMIRSDVRDIRDICHFVL